MRLTLKLPTKYRPAVQYIYMSVWQIGGVIGVVAILKAIPQADINSMALIISFFAGVILPKIWFWAAEDIWFRGPGIDWAAEDLANTMRKHGLPENDWSYNKDDPRDQAIFWCGGYHHVGAEYDRLGWIVRAQRQRNVWHAAWNIVADEYWNVRKPAIDTACIAFGIEPPTPWEGRNQHREETNNG